MENLPLKRNGRKTQRGRNERHCCTRYSRIINRTGGFHVKCIIKPSRVSVEDTRARSLARPPACARARARKEFHLGFSATEIECTARWIYARRERRHRFRRPVHEISMKSVLRAGRDHAQERVTPIVTSFDTYIHTYVSARNGVERGKILWKKSHRLRRQDHVLLKTGLTICTVVWALARVRERSSGSCVVYNTRCDSSGRHARLVAVNSRT